MDGIRFIIEGPGGTDVLRLEHFVPEPPEAGEVLIRHTAIGVNYIDIHHRTGRYPLTYPSPIGIEAAGVVEKIGDGVTAFEVGDRVAYSTLRVGAYSNLRRMPVDRLLHIPDGLDDGLAIAALNKGLTAHFLCHTTHRIVPGETILVHAAAGGVGLILCQWAKHLGARVIGTVSSETKREFALRHGCDEVFIHDKDDFVAGARALTDGRGVSVVYDAVGKDTFEGSLHSLMIRGLLVTFGTASGPIPPFDLFRLNGLGSLYVTSPGFAHHTSEREELVSRANDLFQALASGVLDVPIGQTYALKDAAQAHTDLQARKTIGASILLP